MHLILPENASVSSLFFVYEFKNKFEDRHIAQNAVSVYLVNHYDFMHNVNDDVDIHNEYFENDSYSVVNFYYR